MAKSNDLPMIYRRIRQYAGRFDPPLSDEAICKRAGIRSRDFIRNIKDGKSIDPGAMKLSRVARVLGVELADLLEDRGTPDIAKNRLLSILDQIHDPEHRRRFIDMALSAAELARR